MREIKFRGWNKQSKIMVDNIQCFAPGSAFNLNDAFDPDMIVLPLQYTGLKDKNGVEVYEGDIVKHEEHWSDGRMQSVVSWDTETAEFYPFGSSDWAIYDYEVISNIYENPELLK